MHHTRPLRINMHSSEAWDYSPLNGPNFWSSHYPDAAGEHQSPINIVTSASQHDLPLTSKPLIISHPPKCQYKLTNNGHSVAMVPVMISRGVQVPTLSGGPLQHTYQFDHFHFHWGGESKRGSEHTVNGKSFDAELHLVHWNRQRFMNMKTASCSEGGLAVLGVFLQVGAENKPLRQMTDLLPRVEFKNDSVEVPHFSAKDLLPSNCTEYWTYSGSLTTPPCYESVTWIVFREPITVSPEQLQKFRQTKSYPFYEAPQYEARGCTHCIVDNFRPPQPLNDRVVLRSFK